MKKIVPKINDKNYEEALHLLQQAIGNNTATFRDGQWKAINDIVNMNKRIFVVQRTGWGKSSVYFISTKILRERGFGPTIVISPLLALMRNQIQMAQRLGLYAQTINSSNSKDWRGIKSDFIKKKIDVLFISPERLSNEDFVSTVLQPISSEIGLLVIDEAHCISDWGHDFRPDYQRITEVITRLPPNAPIIATTATANERVIKDVTGQLGEVKLHRGSLNRESLMLQMIELPDRAHRLAWLAEYVPKLEGTGIVYVLTRRDAEQVSKWLNQNGIRSMPYYSSVTSEEFQDTDEYRMHLENLLLSNQIKVLVATVALGMGFDKPDVSFVIHYQAPGSAISYYQQVGRAGRSVSKAYGILLIGKEDEEIHEYFRSTAFPNESQVNEILTVLERHDGLTSKEIVSKVNMRQSRIKAVLKYLSVQNPSPIYIEQKKYFRSAVVYTMDTEKIRRVSSNREEEWSRIKEYAATRKCLMAFLRAELSDTPDNECGRCANCKGAPLIPEGVGEDILKDALIFLKQADIPFETKKQIPKGALVKYDFGYNIPNNLRAEKGRILSRWNDPGWGGIVAQDKHKGCFRDELVNAFVEMIEKRWVPKPEIKWITCVPSHNSPTLVPDFAKKVAAALRVEFLPVISKARKNEPQKVQENSFHQCRNLDGVFRLEERIPSGPVMLIDDIIDSGWTMTILAALLRKQGSGPVYPSALSSTSFEG